MHITLFSTSQCSFPSTDISAALDRLVSAPVVVPSHSLSLSYVCLFYAGLVAADNAGRALQINGVVAVVDCAHASQHLKSGANINLCSMHQRTSAQAYAVEQRFRLLGIGVVFLLKKTTRRRKKEGGKLKRKNKQPHSRTIPAWNTSRGNKYASSTSTPTASCLTKWICDNSQAHTDHTGGDEQEGETKTQKKTAKTGQPGVWFMTLDGFFLTRRIWSVDTVVHGGEEAFLISYIPSRYSLLLPSS